MKKSIIFAALSLCYAGMTLRAQDTTKRKTIDITSSFKPVLREAVKINFNAAPPALDTSRPKLSYTIPAQYLFLNYQPGEMKPVALQRDSVAPWENYDYIKVGVGNIHIPYIRTGFSFGDGKTTFINVYANELHSNGSLPFQQNNMTDFKAVGTYKTPNNLEWNGGVGYKYEGYYLYGFQPDTLKYTSSQLSQDFQTVDAHISLRNTVPTEFGLLYHPNFKVSYFTDNHSAKGTEANSVLNLPLEKQIGKEFAFDLGFTADLTHYNLPNGKSSGQNNNVYTVNPGFLVKNSNLFLQASVTPSWDNNKFWLLPNFLADISTNDRRFTVQLGWIGYYDKGSYQRFESINPWLAQPDSLQNTRMQERYAGIKGSISNHFSYAAKVGFLEYKHMPLFVNDSANGGKDFVIRYESSMEALQFHGEVSYLQGDDFAVTASINANQYHHQESQAKPWGLLPVEFNTHLKWQAFKDFWAKLDLYTFQGAEYLAQNGSAHRGDRGTDLNAGVEFRVLRNLNLWFQMNNIFSDKYQRWNQYQVYGFNVLGGDSVYFWGEISRFALYAKAEAMFQVLNAYLFQHRSISIPGLGTIYLETLPATVDVAERTMLPPAYRFRFDKYFDAPDASFFAYLAAQKNILDYEAIKWYNEFSFDLRNRIRAEDAVSWDGVGILKKDGSGNVLFEPGVTPMLFLQPTPAIRVTRQDAQHTMLVGDRERTSGEMNEWLLDDAVRRNTVPWWVIAIVLGLVCLAILSWYFYEHGLTTGNQTKF